MVHSDPPGGNHVGNGLRWDDSVRREIGSGHPRVKVDYLADDAAPQVGTRYPGDCDLAQVGNLRHGDADRRTTAIRRPYFEVEVDHLIEGDRGVVQSVVQE